MKTLILSAALLFAQPEVQTTVIRSVKFENFKGISMDDVTHRLKDRGVRVMVERVYEPEQVAAARQVLQECWRKKDGAGWK